MTIFHLIGTREFAGTERMVLTIARGQLDRGHKVAVAIRRGSKLEPYLRDSGIEVLKPRVGMTRAPLQLAQIARDRKVDVLHSHLTSAAYKAIMTSWLTRIPVVNHVHVYSPDVSHPYSARRGAIIAVSGHIAGFYAKKVGEKYVHRIHTVLNGTNVLEDPDAAIDREAARCSLAEELGVDPATRFILLAGRMTHQKGQDLLVGAADLLRKQFPSVCYLLVGHDEDISFAQSIRDEISSRDLTGTIRLLGFRKDITRLLRAAEIAVVPSRFDPFPLSTLEPLMLGTPLVATRVGGIPENLNRPEIGVLVEPESVESLAEGIGGLLADPARGRRIADEAERDARRRFSVEAMLDQIDEVYRNVTRTAPNRIPASRISAGR